MLGMIDRKKGGGREGERESMGKKKHTPIIHKINPLIVFHLEHFSPHAPFPIFRSGSLRLDFLGRLGLLFVVIGGDEAGYGGFALAASGGAGGVVFGFGGGGGRWAVF